MVDHTHFLLGEDARNIVLVRWKGTKDIVLIHTLNGNTACIVNNPKCPETRRMISILKERGARVVSSDEIGSGNAALCRDGGRLPEPRRIAAKVEVPRRRRRRAA